MEMRIDFPTEEHDLLQKQLEKFGYAYTTRVSEDMNKFEVGYVLETPWGRRVRISEMREFDSIDQHPFLKELTANQADLISKYGRFKVFKMEYV